MEKGAKYNQSWSGSDGQLKAVALAGAQGLCLGAHLGVCVCVCVCVWCLSDRLINLLLSYRERAPTWDLSVSLKFESLNLKRQLKSLGKHLFFFFFFPRWYFFQSPRDCFHQKNKVRQVITIWGFCWMAAVSWVRSEKVCKVRRSGMDVWNGEQWVNVVRWGNQRDVM